MRHDLVVTDNLDLPDALEVAHAFQPKPEVKFIRIRERHSQAWADGCVNVYWTDDHARDNKRTKCLFE